MGKDGGTSTAAIAATLVLQVVAAAYFLGDGLDDLYLQWAAGPGYEAIGETIVGLALAAGIALGALHLRRLVREAQRQRAVLVGARTAMADLMRLRFAEWRLTEAEADVALFALKGCTIPEIASLRAAAPGTVRSQLSAVYAKAGAPNQAGFVALFIDDLIEPLAR